MAVYNLPYNPANDPYQYWGQALSGMVTGQTNRMDKNQQNEKLLNFAQSIGQNATYEELLKSALESGLEPQDALGLSTAFHKSRPKIGSIPYAVTQMDQQQHKNYLDNYGKPQQINIGQKLLPPEQRQELAELDASEKISKAKAEKEKRDAGEPLTVIETKGVDTIVKAVLGESNTLPFGVRPGAAVTQEEIEKKWDDVKAQTQYDGRGSVARKRIRSSFDIRMGILNKGKGAFTLGNQYAWDRKAYNLKVLQPHLEGIDAEGARLATKAINEGEEPEEIIRLLEERNK